MLTAQILNDLAPGTIIARGEIVDGPLGYNATGSGRQLRWIAVRGGAPDWAVYCYWAESDWDFVRSSGDKIKRRDVIERLVPCTADALERYRP